MTTATEYKQRTQAALARGIQNTAQNRYDLTTWPEDVREIVIIVCELWKLHPPCDKSRKAKWILDARALQDACGEFGVSVLQEYREAFVAFMVAHNGIAFHTVAGPGSLVNMVCDQARQMREKEEQDDPHQRYLSGEFSAFIHH